MTRRLLVLLFLVLPALPTAAWECAPSKACDDMVAYALDVAAACNAARVACETREVEPSPCQPAPAYQPCRDTPHGRTKCNRHRRLEPIR